MEQNLKIMQSQSYLKKGYWVTSVMMILLSHLSPI